MWKSARKAAKTYIFLRNYGGGLYSAHRKITREVPELGLTFNKLKEVDARYRIKHPRYVSWYRKVVKEVTETKQLRNAFGRIRIFLGAEDEIIREGVNFGIQSTAADIINMATIALFKDPLFKKTKAFLTGQIHDALLFEVKNTQVSILKKLIKTHMEKEYVVNNYKAIFPVDISIGDSWYEASL